MKKMKYTTPEIETVVMPENALMGFSNSPTINPAPVNPGTPIEP